MTDFGVHVSGDAEAAVRELVPGLVTDFVASRLTAQDATLWGPEAEAEASVRLGWVEAVSTSLPLVPVIEALRDKLAAAGVTRFVLAGMGGSSLAPEVITRTAGVELTILDSTAPSQVLDALDGDLSTTALIVASKSGSTVETDSQRRAFEAAFADLGIDPAERIIVVTDPDSPLDVSAREAGYYVFNADPNVGGRFSALTAFGLVPSGLAGADVQQLLDEAEAVMLSLAVDTPDNPALALAAAMVGLEPRKDKLVLVADGTHIVGLPDWIEQLVAESTGKSGTGVLPVSALPVSPEVTSTGEFADVQIVRLVGDAGALRLFDRHHGEILVSGTLGAQLLLWEYATAIAGHLLGIDPFNQPDVESAKIAARGLLDGTPEQTAPAFIEDGIEVRSTDPLLTASGNLEDTLDALWAATPADGYISIQAYVNRNELPQLEGLREMVVADAHRPATFGWGPRFLHSTGQYHKGGPANGVFLQILEASEVDLEIPGRAFTFAGLIAAQAAGDAKVLADLGRPVVTLTLTNPAENVEALFAAAQEEA